MLLLSLPLPTMVFPTCSQYFPPLYAVFLHIPMFLLSFPLPAMTFPAFCQYFPPFYAFPAFSYAFALTSSAYHGISYMFQICSSVVRCFPAFSHVFALVSTAYHHLRFHRILCHFCCFTFLFTFSTQCDRCQRSNWYLAMILMGQKSKIKSSISKPGSF